MTKHLSQNWALVTGAVAAFSSWRVTKQMERLDAWDDLGYGTGLFAAIRDNTQVLLDELFWLQVSLSLVLWGVTIFIMWIANSYDPQARAEQPVHS